MWVNSFLYIQAAAPGVNLFGPASSENSFPSYLALVRPFSCCTCLCPSWLLGAKQICQAFCWQLNYSFLFLSFNHGVGTCRSPFVLQVVVEQRLRGSMLRSKLNFVDLAGSERWSEQVEMSEVRVNEMTSINQSLSTLITVVASLTEEGRSHIPYR